MALGLLSTVGLDGTRLLRSEGRPMSPLGGHNSALPAVVPLCCFPSAMAALGHPAQNQTL